MGRLDELVSAQFAKWEQRGRGWHVWPQPTTPEPVFRAFDGFRSPPFLPDSDDGRKPSWIASFFEDIERRLNPRPPPLPEPETEEPEPAVLERSPLTEFRAVLPAKLDIKNEAFRAFLDQLSICAEPLAFELVAQPESISVQFVAADRDTPTLRRQLTNFFREVAFLESRGELENLWRENAAEPAIIEFGLGQEFMLPLNTHFNLDPFVGLVGPLSELRRGELAVFQVLFQHAQHPWQESVRRSITDEDGKPIFVNRPTLLTGSKEKLSSPLFGVVVRIATTAPVFDRALEIARELAFTLRVFARLDHNELIPLHNDDYPFDVHEEDFLHRQSCRNGMLLNADELMGFVHFPSSAVQSPKLRRTLERTKAAPVPASGAHGVVLGENEHLGQIVSVSLSSEERVKHCHVIGASGTGKSTLLFNLIRQDIERGEGVGVLDPHGDLIERILGIIPAERVEDVVFIDPTDEEFSVGFNILSAHSDLEKNLLASDLVSVFRRLSASWGEQMEGVLRNAILAFLESSRGGTLAELRRFLIDRPFREEFLNTVRDPDIVYYWRKGFAQLTGNKSIGPVLTRLETFLAPKPLRYMVAQPTNRLDFADILERGKILLAKLPQGQMGRENSFLLGSLFVAKLQQLAMGRQAQRAESRRPFYLYIDEFHNFITPSMAEILSGARKYRVGLVLAHQELRQLERDSEVASAVMSNPYTRIVFRVGDDDARKLAGGFSFFEARDLQNLETFRAVCRIEKAAHDSNLTIPRPQDPGRDEADAKRKAVITASRKRYATHRAEVEATLFEKLKPEEAEPTTSRSASPSVPKPSEPPPPPKPAEVRNTAVSEQERPATEPVRPPEEIKPEATVIRDPPPPRDLGRGGAQHKSIQDRLQKEAPALGFLAEIEGNAGRGSSRAADLTVRKGSIAIAVEITVTTTTDHEFGNVKKCLAAGFPRVAVVSPYGERLKAITEAVQAGLGSEEAAKVSCFTPDEFIVEMRKLAQEAEASAERSAPKARTRRGFTVSTHGPTLTPEERSVKENISIKVMREVMKDKP